MRSYLAAAAAAAAATAAALIYYLRRCHQHAPAPGPRVLVASKAAAKLEAAKIALGASEVTGMSASSLIADQPLGMEMAMLGAANRLRFICADGNGSEGYDYAVAIENGIVRLQDNGAGELSHGERWLDLAVVAVRDLKTGTTTFASSTGLEFPPHFVGEWAEGGQEGTVGDVIAEQTGCDKQDPHAHLTRNAFSRSALLVDALRVAMATLPLHLEVPPAEGMESDEASGAAGVKV